MSRPWLWLMLNLCLSLCLAACTSQAATPAGVVSPAPAEVTPQATPLIAGGPTASPASAGDLVTEQAPLPPETAAVPTPQEVLVATPLVEPPPAPAAPEVPCVNDARFIDDVTIPDGTQFLPGQWLLKKWSVQNAGTCDWGANYRLVFIEGDALGAPSEVALYPARAGTTAIWEIPMVAAQTPGAYTSRWQARDPAGNLFGAVVFIKINVIPMPTAPSP